MALGDGIGRNKGIKHWSQSRQNDYYRGAKDFIEWLLSNDKYAACMIDTDENCIVCDVGLIEDMYTVSTDELIKQFQDSRQIFASKEGLYMSMPVYNWMIVYSDNSTEIVQADNVADAIENAEGEWYSKGVRAVIRMDYV